MSVLYTIARPYAKAIFEIAVENNSIKEWKEILIFINKIASYKKIQCFLSGALSPKYLSFVFISIGGDKINHHAKNLIKLLSENQRFNILSNILEHFLELEASYKKIIIVELRSSFPLKEIQIFNIRVILEKYLSRKINFIYKIDYYIIDGFIIKINNTVFDLSIRNHLKQLSDALNF